MQSENEQNSLTSLSNINLNIIEQTQNNQKLKEE